MQFVNIDDIKPASYNPRVMTEEKRRQLENSIRLNGFCIPILVNANNNVIIAGHQRTRAAKQVGIEKVPCYFIKDITESDEVLFNQLHNGTDNENGAICTVLENTPKGFSVQANEIFKVKNPQATIVKEICNLLLKYGNVLTLVLMGKRAIVGANYAKACQLLGFEVNVSNINENADGRKLLSDKYGEFSYKDLKKNTWVQGLAQMERHDRSFVGCKANNSSGLYEDVVFNHIGEIEHNSVLDFGCGKGYYIERLNVPIHIGVEFYNNNHHQILKSKTDFQIDKLLNYGNEFDIVVCDSVLNSVDSMEAQTSVMQCLNLFCRHGGHLFISGRTMTSALASQRMKRDSSKCRRMCFLDKDGFTAIFRSGNWYYQKFHSKEDACQLVKRYGFNVLEYKETSTAWRIFAQKTGTLSKEEYQHGVDFEFNLPYPNGSVGRNEEVKEKYGLL